MREILIKSSNISRAEYNEETKELFIIFRSSAKYKYEEVPCEIVNSFEKSESKGNFFYDNIKRKYKTTKL